MTALIAMEEVEWIHDRRKSQYSDQGHVIFANIL